LQKDLQSRGPSGTIQQLETQVEFDKVQQRIDLVIVAKTF